MSKIKISQINLLVNYPLLQIQNDTVRLTKLKDTISIFSYKDIMIYRILQKTDFVTNNKINKSEKYLTYVKGNRYGNLYDSEGALVEKEVLVDSLLSKYAYKGSLFTLTDKYMLDTSIKTDNKIIDKYYFHKESKGMFDSIYYSYEKKTIDHYSLSKNLDSIKKMQLIKVEIIYNQITDTITNNVLILPKRRFTFEIEPIQFVNNPIVISLISKLK